MNEKVLVVVAHPDDEVLMCGGAIAKHVAAGDEVRVLILADGVSSRDGTMNGFQARLLMASKASDVLGCNGEVLGLPDQKLDTLPRLDINKKIEQRIRDFMPSIVYTHWHGDMNSDHRIVSECTKVACRPMPGQSVKQLLMGEVPSSTEWASGFNPASHVDISSTMIRKLEALACYQEEMREGFHPRSIASIKAMAQLRGAAIGVEAAESFELVRMVA